MKKLVFATLSFFLSITSLGVTAYASNLTIGSQGSEVRYIQESLKELNYFTYEKVTGYYGNVTADSVKKFQIENNLEATGIVDNITRDAIREKNGDKPSNTSASVKSNIKWFDEAQYIFSRETNAVITDVDTGKTFNIKRTFGRNHADVEPLTTEDTKTIKEIWGGFTWERRAITVQVGDVIMPASMVSMFHAGVDSKPSAQVVSGRSGGYGRGQNLDSVKNNGVNGVVDLHFAGSMTHGSNRVDKGHQNMVLKAQQYLLKNF